MISCGSRLACLKKIIGFFMYAITSGRCSGLAKVVVIPNRVDSLLPLLELRSLMISNAANASV